MLIKHSHHFIRWI